LPGWGQRSKRITIVANDSRESELFRREYRVHGFDVCWEPTWDGKDSLRVLVYDYGPGTRYYDARENNMPSSHLCTLAYRLDPKTGVFAETLLSELETTFPEPQKPSQR
jgi:hypothetical protein